MHCNLISFIFACLGCMCAHVESAVGPALLIEGVYLPAASGDPVPCPINSPIID